MQQLLELAVGNRRDLVGGRHEILNQQQQTEGGDRESDVETDVLRHEQALGPRAAIETKGFKPLERDDFSSNRHPALSL